MKRLISLVVLASLLTAPIAHSAPKKIAVKPMQLLTTLGSPEEVSGAVVSGKSIIVYGTKSSKAYARAIDATGKELWNLSLDQSVASIATAAAVDSAGDIWVAGATPLAMGAIAPTPTVTPLNPDNAVIPANVFVGDLHAVTIWKVSAAGSLLFTNTLPTSYVLFPTAIAVDKAGASVVGIMGTDKGNAGFLANTDSAGVFSKLLQIGTASHVQHMGLGSSVGDYWVINLITQAAGIGPKEISASEAFKAGFQSAGTNYASGEYPTYLSLGQTNFQMNEYISLYEQKTMYLANFWPVSLDGGHVNTSGGFQTALGVGFWKEL